MSDITLGEVQELLARWWFSYDNGDFEALPGLLTEDTWIRVRTDSGATDYEEFIRADESGRERVLAWNVQHRLDSPYPLRHNATNIHLTGAAGGDMTFASYIYVTHVEGVMPAGLSSAIVTGSVRRVDGQMQIAGLEIVLDMTPSTTFRDVRGEG